MIEEGKLDNKVNPLKVSRIIVSRVGHVCMKRVGMTSCYLSLQCAPHCLADIVATEWDRPYPREMGCLPAVSCSFFNFCLKHDIDVTS